MKGVIDLNFLNLTRYADPISLTESAYVLGQTRILLIILALAQISPNFSVRAQQISIVSAQTTAS